MSHRKVHFSVPLHQIEYLDQQWETASRLARDGSSWLRMGIDRQRFRDRIERTAEVLNRILDTEFRQEIFRERFENHHITDSYESVKRTTSGETSQSTIVADQRKNCKLVNKNKPGEHGDSPDFRREQKRQQQQPQPQVEVKYTNRKSTKKKSKRRKKRGKGRVRKRKRKD